MERIDTGKKLGGGREKTVFKHADKPDKVVAVYHTTSNERLESVRTVRARFYLSKLLNMIFPKQTRKIYSSYSEPRSMVSSRIESKFVRKVKNIFVLSFEGAASISSALREKCGVEIDDTNNNNFMYDKADNLIYIDSFDPWSNGVLNFNPEKLRIAIEELGGAEKTQAGGYLERLIKLGEEEGLL